MSTFPDPEYVMCPGCGQEVTYWDDSLSRATCPECGTDLRAAKAAQDSEHDPVSLDGWTCDICGRSVNGQTDADGRPIHDGWVVKHAED